MPSRPLVVRPRPERVLQRCDSPSLLLARLGELDREAFRRILPVGTGCWIWLGTWDPMGYGQLGRHGRAHKAHRYVYELLCGDVPEGLELDHLCRVRCCVFPSHLEPVTHDENIRRAPNSNVNKTHCIRGHLLAGPNLAPSRQGRRICRTCRDARRRAYSTKGGREVTSPDLPDIGRGFPTDGTEVCGRHDPELWFPHKGGNAATAKVLCNICPREDDCLSFALEHREAYGVWGGLTEPERRQLSRRRVAS